MSQLQKTKEPRKLFRYQIEQNEQLYNQEKLFFYRTNRWRFNTRDVSSPLKFNRLKFPLLIGGAVIVLWDFTYGYRASPAAH